MYYLSVYNNLCSSRSQLKEHWTSGSGLHRHHIIPRHMGGEDTDENFTYLTPREHVIAHFLLWKIYKNPNDLRSMHMLGAKLTVEQRKIVGYFCRDNNIGFFSASEEDRKRWRLNGLQTQKNSGDTNSFYFWSTEEGRKKRASMGGKVGSRVQIEKKIAIFDPEVQRKAAVLGAKSHKGKRCMYLPGDSTFIRVLQSDIERRLSEGYVFGSPHKSTGRPGYRWVYNALGHALRIHPDLVPEYTAKGYSLGRGRKRTRTLVSG